MRKSLRIAAAALALGMLPIHGAGATELRYIIDVYGQNALLETVTFQLPQTPIPNSYVLSVNAVSGQFTIDDITEFVDRTPMVTDLYFYSTYPGGGGAGGVVFSLGPNISPLLLLNEIGGQMYLGLENAPYLLTGDFDEGNNYSFETITVFALPEPSTWAMTLVGFAGVGYAGYRRSRRQGERRQLV